MTRKNKDLVWLELHWQRPYEAEAVTDLLTHLASHSPETPVIMEARGHHGSVSYYVDVDRLYRKQIIDIFSAHGDIQFTEAPATERLPLNAARNLKITKPSLSLKTDLTEAVVRAGLSALLQARGDEQIALQIVLGPFHSPAPTPHYLSDPHAGWLKTAFGNVDPATAESKTVIREKLSGYSFSATVRLGASGERKIAAGHLLSLLSALRTLSSAGVNIRASDEDPDRLNGGHVPRLFPLRLSVKEVANFLLLPVGDTELPGVAGLHPKQQLPPAWYLNPSSRDSRVFARSLDGRHQLSISPKDSLEHTIILGPTGSGKSTAMQHLILSDIHAGRSVLVIDPKADLVNDILARIPEEREGDVVIIDPSEDSPVGFNPLAFKSYQNPGLIADAVLAVFQEVFKENWGIRSQDVISASLLTLVQAKGSSLLWLPTLLTDENFRAKVTAGITDRIGLLPFWSAFESMRDSERRQEIAPVLNKVRQFLLRPGLRNVLGQSDPKFNLAELFTKPKIVLVPLNRGIIGPESAKLLGSLIVGLTWTLALSRARLPAEQRRLVSVYIDELQDYLSLPTDLSDALAQARGLGVGLTLAHQYREQLPPEIRAGVDANARNKIVFGLSASDAKSMAAMAPGLTPEDFMTLPRYQVYASFNQNGRNTGWVSGVTSPMTPALRDPRELREQVMARYGKPGAEVEQEYYDLIEASGNRAADIAPVAVGRAKQ